MSSWPDLVVIGLRALAFITTAQTVGLALFLGFIDTRLDASTGPLRVLTSLSALSASLVLLLQHLLEPARFVGALDGVFDSTFQTLLLTSDAGASRALRLAGLILLACCFAGQSGSHRRLGLIAGTIVLGSFLLMGHTVGHPQRWLLAPLLLAHLLLAAWWFGAIAAFWISATREPVDVIGRLAREFSRAAVRLVPGIAVAGLIMAIVLLPDLTAIDSPYGKSLGAKLVAFVVLLGLATANKYRLAPRIAGGDVAALVAFRAIVGIEWIVIAGVLALTAVMTGLFGPS